MATLTKSRKAKQNGQAHRAIAVEDVEPKEFFRRPYIVFYLTVPAMDVPEHPLSIPGGWARQMNGDFSAADYEFMSRTRAMAVAASWNRAAMNEYDDDVTDGDRKIKWAFIFEIGGIEDTSHIVIDGGCKADFILDTCLMLVRPTAEEIAKQAGAKAVKHG